MHTCIHRHHNAHIWPCTVHDLLTVKYPAGEDAESQLANLRASNAALTQRLTALQEDKVAAETSVHEVKESCEKRAKEAEERVKQLQERLDRATGVCVCMYVCMYVAHVHVSRNIECGVSCTQSVLCSWRKHA